MYLLFIVCFSLILIIANFFLNIIIVCCVTGSPKALVRTQQTHLPREQVGDLWPLCCEGQLHHTREWSRLERERVCACVWKREREREREIPLLLLSGYSATLFNSISSLTSSTLLPCFTIPAHMCYAMLIIELFKKGFSFLLFNND